MPQTHCLARQTGGETLNKPSFQNPQLDGADFFLSGGDTGILLLHGFTATTVEVRPLANILNQAGVTVSAPLLPGHGTHPEDLLPMAWESWVSKAAESLDGLTKSCSRVFVGGESMGGLIALLLAHQFPSVAGVVIFAPALIIPGSWKAYLVAPFKKIIPKTYVSEREEIHPWQGYTVIPVPALLQVRKMQSIVRKILPKITQPVRIFQGLQDGTINPQGAQYIYDKLGSKDKDIDWLPNSPHCLILDQDLETVAQQVLTFLKPTPRGDQHNR